MTFKINQIITNGKQCVICEWALLSVCIYLVCGGCSCIISAREGVPRLLIDGIWRNWVMIQLLTKCVSCFCVFLLLHDDVCKSLMLSWASRPLMNHLSEIYFYNPTRSAFLHLHLNIYSLIYSIHWFTFAHVNNTVEIHFNISRNKFNNHTVAQQKKCKECQSIQWSAVGWLYYETKSNDGKFSTSSIRHSQSSFSRCGGGRGGLPETINHPD